MTHAINNVNPLTTRMGLVNLFAIIFVVKVQSFYSPQRNGGSARMRRRFDR